MAWQHRATGKRAESRLRVRLPARLITLDCNLEVILCDLSKSGARIEYPGAPLRSRDAVLTWRDFEAFGRILWSHSGESGIGFYDPIALEWLIATREVGDADILTDQRKLARHHALAWVKGQTRV